MSILIAVSISAVSLATSQSGWRWIVPESQQERHAQVQTQVQEVQDLDPFDSAILKSRRLSIPMVVLITGDNCPHCDRLKSSLASWGRRKDIVYFVLDSSKRPELAKRVGGGFKVIPVVCISTTQGWGRHRFGFASKEVIARHLGISPR